ncbi:threonine aldolase family protein [Aeromicrobium sp. P5_D10]
MQTQLAAGLSTHAVNLGSDTQTRPSRAMREFMLDAEVGDEQAFDDPTTRALEERVAELLGHEAGVFMPSGTMCNEIAVRLHTGGGGDEVLAEATSHLINAEAGGPAVLSGVVVTSIRGERGVFSADQVTSAVRGASRYAPRTKLLCVEQTANAGGGRVWTLDQITSVVDAAKDRGLATHLDGARLLNASVASGVSAADFASIFDSAWLDFSKGLGAPVGAVLVGSQELVTEAWRYKQMWGGAMRQSGIIAAAGLYALDHNVERLAEDHENAKVLARGLATIDGVDIDPELIESNIVYFEVADAPAFEAGLAQHGVVMNAKGPRRVRAVTHLDVSAAQIQEAIEAAKAVLGSS